MKKNVLLIIWIALFAYGPWSIVSGQAIPEDASAPADSLIRKIIARMPLNQIEYQPYFQFDQYERSSLSITELNPDQQNKKIFDAIQFLFHYVDTSDVAGGRIKTFSVREALSTVYQRKKPSTRKSIVTAIRYKSADKKNESKRLDALFTEAIQQVDVTDDRVDLFFKRFVSPVSSEHALSFYRYSIAGTLEHEGQTYVNLVFEPYNKQDPGFVGNMWITTDGSYAIRKIVLNTPPEINLNFVTKTTIVQEFEPLPEGHWVKTRESSLAAFSFLKIRYNLLVQSEKILKNYTVTQDPLLHFGFNDEVVMGEKAENQPDSVWQGYRPVFLNKKESKEEKESAFILDLEKLPFYDALVECTQILLTNYAHTSKRLEDSKFDLGPIWSTISRNDVEGYRFRLGGRTTAHFSKHFFLKGYGAYGTLDKKWMYSGEAIYSFDSRAYFEDEYRKNNLGLVYQNDIHTPGQEYLYASPDNIFLSFKRGKADKMTYIRKTEIWYEREFGSGFYWKFWGKSWDETAAGSLQFLRKYPDGRTVDIGSYNEVELGLMLRLTFNEKFYEGRDSRMVLHRDGPVFTLSQNVGLKGVFGSNYNYYFADFSVQKRFWFSDRGHLNGIVKAGKLWGQAPFPLLILPNANQTYTIQPESYSMMNTLEFINDKYVSLDLAYHLDGWLFNRIGFLRKLKLREVLSFKGLMGNLSPGNNPDYNRTLFLFPENSYTMGNDPYMEVGVGIENIFKVLRVDYVRRLTYLSNADIDKNGLRVTIVLSF